MAKQISPFAALSNADKQLRWLEYQSIRLPYISADLESGDAENTLPASSSKAVHPRLDPQTKAVEYPQPPPEIPRSMPSEFSKTRHGQYDAGIARMKQAELQARRSMNSQTPQ